MAKLTQGSGEKVAFCGNDLEAEPKLHIAGRQDPRLCSALDSCHLDVM